MPSGLQQDNFAIAFVTPSARERQGVGSVFNRSSTRKRSNFTDFTCEDATARLVKVLQTTGLRRLACQRFPADDQHEIFNILLVGPRPHHRRPRLRPGPRFADHRRAGGFARRSISSGVRVRLLRAAVLSLRARRGGGHGRGNGIDDACAVGCGWVQDVVDGAGVVVGADPPGKLLALVKLNWWRDETGMGLSCCCKNFGVCWSRGWLQGLCGRVWSICERLFSRWIIEGAGKIEQSCAVLRCLQGCAATGVGIVLD